MTDNEIIKALECCYDLDSSAICHQCPLYQTEECRDGYLGLQAYHLINRQQAEIERLKAFKSYFDELYGKGLDVANWHLNSELEPFDNFYESALQEVVGEE